MVVPVLPLHFLGHHYHYHYHHQIHLFKIKSIKYFHIRVDIV